MFAAAAMYIPGDNTVACRAGHTIKGSSVECFVVGLWALVLSWWQVLLVLLMMMLVWLVRLSA